MSIPNAIHNLWIGSLRPPILAHVVRRFQCPYLSAEVDLTDERWAHIVAGHPELVADGLSRIATTLSDPDEIRHDPRFSGTRLFSRWFEDYLGGKILVAAVVLDEPEIMDRPRHWIVTAYVTRRLPKGLIEWSRH